MKRFDARQLLLVILIALCLAFPPDCHGVASGNIPLDSPVYSWLDKLAGVGLITSDLRGIRPFSKAEAARLTAEAEDNFRSYSGPGRGLAEEAIGRLRLLLPREMALRASPEKAPSFDFNPLASARFRYLHLDGVPRDYNRDVHDPAHQSVFGFIGGDLRPLGDGGIVHTTGTEGTPLLENNEGVVFAAGNSAELRWSMEGYLYDKGMLLLEPELLTTPGTTQATLQKGYVKLGDGGAELEAGRDAVWFGPGFRGSTVLTNNAKNFDLIKVSSPEPVDVGWVKKYLGDLKYLLLFSRFDATGSGVDYRRPYLFGMKLALKPRPWYEIGFNLVRQTGGPGFSGGSTVREQIFGGGDNDHTNSIAGWDLRFRIPWLRNTEIYGEYSGEDSAGFWPVVESYVAGINIPCLTASGRDELRFEYFWGSQMLYGDWQFPAGYVYHGMTPGHSQGTAAQDFYLRYGHWFSLRQQVVLEYFHTERGKVGRLPGESVEEKNSWRGSWSLPLYGDFDGNLLYGWERVNNLNLEGGVKRTNQLLKVEVRWRY